MSRCLRAVLDTQVWLDWLHFADPHCAGFGRAVDDGRLQIVSREDCRDEWCRVLAYPKLAIAPPRRRALIAAYDAWAMPLAPETFPEPKKALPRCRDKDDQKFIELAVAAGAALLLSRDAAVIALDRRLRRDFAIAVVAPTAVGGWLGRAQSGTR